jgi:hypothetical protein
MADHKEEKKYGGRVMLSYQSYDKDAEAQFMPVLQEFVENLAKKNIWCYVVIQNGTPPGGCVPGSIGCPG